MRFVQRASPLLESRWAAHWLSDGAISLVAVALDPMGRVGATTARDLLARAAAEVVGIAPELWPAAIGSRLDHALRQAAPAAQPWMLFAAATMTRAAVHVCTAGDLRIHLVSAGCVAHMTRDHIVANESPDWLRQTYGDAPLAFHATMLTRSLGSGDRRPESASWPTTSDSSLWICSSAVHQFRPPEQYLASLLEAEEPDALVIGLERD